MWKGSLGFTNVSCKSIREATHQIQTPCRSTAASVRGCRHIYLRYEPMEALMQCLDVTDWPRAPLPQLGQMARLTSCTSDELLRMLTFSVLEVPTGVAGKV